MASKFPVDHIDPDRAALWPAAAAIDEDTPIPDPAKPIAGQYYAEPYMLQYARTKTMGELAVRELAPAMRVDLLSPTVMADLDRILESASWSALRKVVALYRRTHYFYAGDAACFGSKGSGVRNSPLWPLSFQNSVRIRLSGFGSRISAKLDLCPWRAKARSSAAWPAHCCPCGGARPAHQFT